MTTKSSNIDVMRRDDRRAGTFERCEVIEVYPHVKPHPSDPESDVQDFNKVKVQLIDRPIDKMTRMPVRYDLPVAQRFHGLFQGQPYTPRVGDMVIMAWLRDDVGVILCPIPSAEQEPVCRSLATSDHQEFVFKLCPHEAPGQDDLGNFTEFPPPKRPTCFKWWPVDAGGSPRLDSLLVFDCKNGNDCPSCDQTAPCNKPDDIKLRTWFKNFSSNSDTSTDLPWRFKFHHNSESVFLFDNDRTIHEANKEACSTCGGTGCDGVCPACDGTKLIDGELCSACQGTGEDVCPACNGSGCATELGHQHFYPEGTNDIHAGQDQPNKGFLTLKEEGTGVRVSVVHPDDDQDFAFEAIQFETGAYIRILKNGDVSIYTPGTCTIKADVKIVLDSDVDITGDLHVFKDEQVDGTCSGPNNVQ